MRIVIAALIAVLLLACQPGGSDPATTEARGTPGASKEPAPAAKAVSTEEVTHPTLIVTTLDGSQYDLTARRGKWVVVNFWATWCNPCLKEMPELSALAAMRDDLEVLGLAFEEIEPAEMKAFLDKHPVAYPIAIVDTYASPVDFDEPRGLPMTYLIAPDGQVAEKILGPVTAADIEHIIAAAAIVTEEGAPDARSDS